MKTKTWDEKATTTTTTTVQIQTQQAEQFSRISRQVFRFLFFSRSLGGLSKQNICLTISTVTNK